MQTVNIKLSYCQYLYISVCVSPWSLCFYSWECCGCVTQVMWPVICVHVWVCICRTQYVLFTLFCRLYTQIVMHDRKCPHCVNTKATLTISTLTAAMRITPGCRPFLLLFHFSIGVLLASICSVIPPFPLCFPLSTPLIQLWETLTNAHASHKQEYSLLSGFLRVITSRNALCAKYREVRGQGMACGSGQGGLHM